MNVRYYRLRTGDELFGQLDDSNDGYDLIVLQKPCRLLLTQKVGYVIQPLPVETITFNRQEVVFDGVIDDELRRHYQDEILGQPTLATPLGLARA